MYSAIYFKLLRINAKYMRYSTLLENDKFIYLGKIIKDLTAPVHGFSNS